MNSSGSEFVRLEELKERALALPPAERDKFLREHCQDDQLRAEIESRIADSESTRAWQPEGAAASIPRTIPKVDETLANSESTTPGVPARAAGSNDPTMLYSVVPGDNEASSEHHGQIGEYDLNEELARGGMGIVFKARHRVLQRLVAIKIPLAAALEAGEERFLREARSAAALRHANVCPIYEVGHTGSHPFIALGFVDGSTLQDWGIAERPKARHIAETIAKVARAVHYAHDHGVIHRDIKPSNVMIDRENGEPILMDFGLAKQLADQGSEMTRDGQVMGTPSYMAPEQAAGRLDEVGPLADVYALGALLYNLLTGQAPFLGPIGEVIRKVQSEEPLPPRKFSAAVHRDLETICLKAMAKQPAARYDSAAALAEDLERFAAGAPILARRESVVSRLRRLGARHGVLVGTILLILLLAGSVVAYVGSGARTARTVAGLTASFNTALQSEKWSPADRDALERQLAELATYDAEGAQSLRTQLYRTFAGRLRNEIVSPTSIAAGDLERFEAGFQWLEARHAAAAPPLRETLQRRLRTWQPVFRLSSPYDGVTDLFPANEVGLDDGILVHNEIREAGNPGQSPDDLDSRPVVLAAPACQGNVRLKAVFDARWKNASEIGLLLHADQQSGYLFRVQVSADQAQEVRRKDGSIGATTEVRFWHILSAGGKVDVEILRDGQLLRQTSIRPHDLINSDGTLSMTAECEGNRIQVSVGRQPALVFEDVFFHTGGARQRYGVWWPLDVGLVSLEASEQPLPIAPSPLERGDELFAKKEWDAALTQYRQQAGRAVDDRSRNQAHFKEAVCLLRLERPHEAAPLLHQLAVEAGPDLQLLASCQLWRLHLQQEQYDEAGVVFANLQARYDFQQLTLLLPEEDRRDIMRRVYETTIGLNLFRFNEESLGFLVRADAVSQLLAPNESAEDRQLRALQLVRGFHVTGHLDRGIQHARSYLWNSQDAFTGVIVELTAECSWMLRQQGQFQEALRLVSGLLKPDSPGLEHRKLLLVERARIFAAEQQWERAEADLDRYLAMPSQQLQYREFSGACLMRGFLYRRRGEEEAAREVWRRGLHRNWLAQRPAGSTDSAIMSGMAALSAVLIGAMSEEMTQEEVIRLLGNAKPVAGGGLTGQLVGQYLQTIAPSVAHMARSERAQEVIRQLAFQETPLREHLSAPLALIITEFARRGAATTGEWKPSEEEVIGQLVHDAMDEYRQGKFTEAQVVQILLAWKGTTGVFGWQSVAPTLAAQLRGPTAYILGHRFRKLGRGEDAVKFFRTAQEDAADDSPLVELVQAELESAE